MERRQAKAEQGAKRNNGTNLPRQQNRTKTDTKRPKHKRKHMLTRGGRPSGGGRPQPPRSDVAQGAPCRGQWGSCGEACLVEGLNQPGCRGAVRPRCRVGALRGDRGRGGGRAHRRGCGGRSRRRSCRRRSDAGGAPLAAGAACHRPAASPPLSRSGQLGRSRRTQGSKPRSGRHAAEAVGRLRPGAPRRLFPRRAGRGWPPGRCSCPKGPMVPPAGPGPRSLHCDQRSPPSAHCRPARVLQEPPRPRRSQTAATSFGRSCPPEPRAGIRAACRAGGARGMGPTSRERCPQAGPLRRSRGPAIGRRGARWCRGRPAPV